MPETKSKHKSKSVETDDILDNETRTEVSKAEELAGTIIESARHTGNEITYGEINVMLSDSNPDKDLLEEIYDIVKEEWPEGKPIRMITVTGINLTDKKAGEQLSLFTGVSDGNQTELASDGGRAAAEADESVERTMDEIRKKFGSSSIKFGKVIGSDIGVDS